MVQAHSASDAARHRRHRTAGGYLRCGRAATWTGSTGQANDQVHSQSLWHTDSKRTGAGTPPHTLNVHRVASGRPPPLLSLRQTQTLAHGDALRRTLGHTESSGYRPGTDAIAKITLCATKSTSASASASISEAAANAVHAVGWQPTYPGLERLRELLDASVTMRMECASVQSDQASRLDALLEAQFSQLRMAWRTSATLLATVTTTGISFAMQGRPPPVGLVEMQLQLSQVLYAVANCTSMLANMLLTMPVLQGTRVASATRDLILLCHRWVARIQGFLRATDTASCIIPEVMKLRQFLRSSLRAQILDLHQTAGLTSSMHLQHASRINCFSSGLATFGHRAAYNNCRSSHATIAIWDKQRALFETQMSLSRQESVLQWLLCSGLPEGVRAPAAKPG